ncbi:MAG: hypothetical protein PHC83_01445 [Bacteroidales bacterium]|nr:hypothetical protein [Bacteroidales bacterium]MDD4208780.1 hypothetical protein [Bacteroidales bacterium]
MKTISTLCLCFSLFFLHPVTLAQTDYEKKNNIKITLLSLMSGSTKITYERKVLPKQSIEITGGIIGLGFDFLNHNQSKGVLGRFAYKFIFPVKNHYPLDGWYVKPELAFSAYTYNHITGEMDVERLAVSRLAMMGVGGYQMVKMWFVFDIFAGFGLGIGNANLCNYHHGFIGLNSESLLTLTAGFKIGVAF